MKFIYGIQNINKKIIKSCVLTIGNFDGVHLGHQYLLKKLYEKGKKNNLPVVVIIFEPQPKEFFYSKNNLIRLTNLRDKLFYFNKNKVDFVICIRFNNFLSQTSPKLFIYSLIKKINFKLLIIGDDFRFGLKKQGDLNFLKNISNIHKFKLINIKSFNVDNIRVSSSFIRKLILNNKFDIAKKFLGHSYFISGKIVYGDSLGKKIGFPTANIFNQYISLNKGVYAVYIYGISNIPLQGILNFGTRPTFFGKSQKYEVYIFNIQENLYGKYINLKIIKKIRKEKKFNSVNDLKKQINKDIKYAKKFLF